MDNERALLMLFTLKDTSTEVGELEAKVKGKEQMIASLQEEILSMTVRKELLSSAVEKVQHRHQEQVEQVACQQREIEAKISEYAVLAPTSKLYYVCGDADADRQGVPFGFSQSHSLSNPSLRAALTGLE